MTSIIQNLNEVEFYSNMLNEFKKIYPDLDPLSIDSDLLQDMLENIVHQNNINNNDNINNINDDIMNNIISAHEIIPEMSIPTNLIYLKGRINNVPVNIMVDTGASRCFTYKSIITKCGVEHLIDTQSKMIVQSAHGKKISVGTIWFLEIDLDIGNGQEQWVSVPITVEVNDDCNDSNIDELKEKMNLEQVKKKSDTENNAINKELEIILGINFLKSYGANIDFSTRTLTLNNSIKIKFNQ